MTSESNIKDQLSEITLCYPWGTGKKLVRDGLSRKWLVVNDRTNARQYLADLNNNYVNSTIAATISALQQISSRDAANPFPVDVDEFALQAIEARVENIWEDANADFDAACGGAYSLHSVFADRIISATFQEIAKAKEKV